MKIEKTTSFKGLLNSRYLKKGLEFASDNGSLFAASTCVALSCAIRPVAILLTPKAKKEDKQYACVKSITSGIVGLGIMAAVSIPVSKAMKNITKFPSKYLKQNTVEVLKNGSKSLEKSATYNFASQMVKLSSGFVTALPKAFLTSAFIPPLLDVLFAKNNQQKSVKISNSKVSFKGNVKKPLTALVAKILDNEHLHKFSKKFKDTNLAQHMFSLNDIFATGLFIGFTKQNKSIDEKRKNTLCYNAAISTGLTISLGYGVSKILDKPTNILVKKFVEANKDDKKLHKYIDGIKIVKPAIILGSLYYIIAPVVSTILADKLSDKKESN